MLSTVSFKVNRIKTELAHSPEDVVIFVAALRARSVKIACHLRGQVDVRSF